MNLSPVALSAAFLEPSQTLHGSEHRCSVTRRRRILVLARLKPASSSPLQSLLLRPFLIHEITFLLRQELLVMELLEKQGHFFRRLSLIYTHISSFSWLRWRGTTSAARSLLNLPTG